MARNDLYTIDDLIRHLSLSGEPIPCLAYPKTPKGLANYEVLTTKALDRLVDCAAKHLVRQGLVQVASNCEDVTVALIGVSDIDYIVNLFALSRLGYVAVLLSPRLALDGYLHLLEETQSQWLLYSSHLSTIADQVRHTWLGNHLPIPSRHKYDILDIGPRIQRDVHGPSETLRKAIVLHSSGSTKQPRPIYFTHARLLAICLPAMEYKAFISVPLFHTHGFSIMLQTLYKHQPLYIFNQNMPHTHQNLVNAIQAAQPEIVYTVPYVLKLLAEGQDGIDVLKACKVVSSSGSQCPDELGELLTEAGVHLGCMYGSTETAQVFTSLKRPRCDKAWNYLRPVPHVAPFILMKPVGGDTYELVVLEGHKARATSNSNDPPNSYHTGDLFQPHPTITNAWKAVGRLDDCITMTTGEKMLPLSIEGRVRQDSLVKEAVVFGTGKPHLGLLVFRANSSERFNDDEYLDCVWPAIQDANSRAEEYSQIRRDAVVLIPASIDCPSTDKASIQRALIYQKFAHLIDGAYTRLESPFEGSLKLSIPALEAWIVQTLKVQFGIFVPHVMTDFFDLGVDSSKALQFRSIIISELSLSSLGSKLSPMVVLDCGNTEVLAKALNDLQHGRESNAACVADQMSALIEEYQILPISPKIKHADGFPKGFTVLLTGASGFLGSQLLFDLLRNPAVFAVWCHVRAPSVTEALARISSAFGSISQVPSSEFQSKLNVFIGDLASPALGLSKDQISHLTSHLTHIIHAAYPVNFNLSLPSFRSQILICNSLLNFSLSLNRIPPAHFLFCSSISTAPGSINSKLIPSAPIHSLDEASSTGYGQSKLVCEHIIEAAVSTANVRATILRIGQIIPSRSAQWPPNQSIPLLIHSALTTGALPITLGTQDQLAWLPVDIISHTILELAHIAPTENMKPSFSEAIPQLVYNICNPHTFSWSRDAVPALRAAGLAFEAVPWREWLKRMRASELDAEKNPSIKLLGFWEKKWDGGYAEQAIGGTEDEKMDAGISDVTFDTQAAVRDSGAMRGAPDIVEAGLLDRLVREWIREWKINPCS
ncbi:hypothetical protein MMC26_006386 [Xylographa opegraphella]|nr:hypothetical protein [Xylographa opegraphella]